MAPGALAHAIDSALLSYGSISSGGISVLADRDNFAQTREAIGKDPRSAGVAVVDGPDSVPKDFAVLHIRQRAQEVSIPMILKFGRPDIILIDANIEPKLSANLAVLFSDTLNNDAALILTVKLVDGDVDKHIAAAVKVLEGKYGDIVLKKLPHNRSELTLFARKT